MCATYVRMLYSTYTWYICMYWSFFIEVLHICVHCQNTIVHRVKEMLSCMCMYVGYCCKGDGTYIHYIMLMFRTIICAKYEWERSLVLYVLLEEGKSCIVEQLSTID